jgi:hypothetical protein
MKISISIDVPKDLEGFVKEQMKEYEKRIQKNVNFMKSIHKTKLNEGEGRALKISYLSIIYGIDTNTAIIMIKKYCEYFGIDVDSIF